MGYQLKSMKPICNVPWMHSMMDAKTYHEVSLTKFGSCNSTDAYLSADNILFKFATQAARFEHPNCTGIFIPIEIISYCNIYICKKVIIQ